MKRSKTREHPGFEIMRRSRMRRRLSSPWFVLAQLAIGIVFGVGVFDRVLMPIALRHGADAAVPNLRRDSKEDGEREIAKANLRLGNVMEVSDPDAPNGQIISQQPAPGAHVRKGRRVNIVLSAGPPVRLVPDLAGKTPRSATLALGQLELRTGATLSVPSATIPVGSIIGTHPAVGESPGRSGSVDLLISSGPDRALYVMPDLRGLDATDAASRLRGAGILVESEGFGAVQRQDPAPGEPIWSGETARID
jgi:eukaryotic-like serine/threonine-protein kinase